MFRETIFVFAALVVLASCTRVNKCGNGQRLEDENQVQISNCNAPPCKLKRRTQTTIELKFVPDRDVQSLTTSVHAMVLGVPLPFVGVDGTSACKDVSNADGTKAQCPLKKGVEYRYKNTFPILPFYPTINLVVHYALVEGDQTITCFEVPAKITN